MVDNKDKQLNFLGYCASSTILKKIYKNEKLDSSDMQIVSILLEEYRELLYKVKDFNITYNLEKQDNEIY